MSNILRGVSCIASRLFGTNVVGWCRSVGTLGGIFLARGVHLDWIEPSVRIGCGEGTRFSCVVVDQGRGECVSEMVVVRGRSEVGRRVPLDKWVSRDTIVQSGSGCQLSRGRVMGRWFVSGGKI